MPKLNLKDSPKLFCEQAQVGYNAEAFIAAFLAGQNANVYAFSPQHAKRLKQALEYNIEKYEKQFGEIMAEWNPNVKSPIQSVNLNNSSEEDKEQ